MKAFLIQVQKRTNHGFSLVELMVVVAIIGILAAIAVPKFNQFRGKAIQAEATNGLGSIHSLNHLYYAENDSFAPAIADLTAFSGNDNANRKYDFITAGGANTFLATATARAKLCPGATIDDVWTIDTNAVLTNTAVGTTNC